jgi:hypothetical protein
MPSEANDQAPLDRVPSLVEKLDEMTLHDETGNPRDAGYMAAVREIREWVVAHPSKAHPDSRHHGIGFKIGEAFPADDPIARWATALAMAANDAVYLNVHMIEGDLPPELDVYYFRLVASHFIEAVDWIRDTRRIWPEIDQFIQSLDEDSQARCDRLLAFADKKHPLYEMLRRSRNTLFHYPVMHPERESAGAEELANAMDDAKDLEGWIEDGGHYATFRATFADTVALQFLTGSEEETIELADQLNAPVFELAEFTMDVLLAQLKRVPKNKTTLWRTGEAKPAIV